MANTARTITLTVDPMFSGLYVLQRDFQARLLGKIPADLTGDARKEYIREQALALTDELHEALAETGWKSWASGDAWINREAFAGEMADVFIFMMNLLLVADVTPADLMDKVKTKIAKNHKRQDDGYDGVATKCAGCGRALDDDAVKCTPPSGELANGEGASCEMYGLRLSDGTWTAGI